jgi:hypothetical protein
MKPIEIWQVDSVIGKGEKDGDIRRDSNYCQIFAKVFDQDCHTISSVNTLNN